MTIQVKICGITNLEDAVAAVKAGAEMIGYNFYPRSPRYISPARCIMLQNGLKQLGLEVVSVGVFVNEDTKTVQRILKDCGIDYAQLSGDESPEELRKLGANGFKAIRPQTPMDADNLADRFSNAKIAPSLLLDAYHPTQYGGTGNQTNPAIARQLASRYKILLAGGLGPENVAEAVANVAPWGVDVASGVESEPGVKDHHKIRVFTRMAKGLSHQSQKGNK